MGRQGLMVNFLVQKNTELVNTIHGFTLERVRNGLLMAVVVRPN